MNRLRLPGPVGRRTLQVAACTWVGSVAPRFRADTPNLAVAVFSMAVVGAVLAIFTLVRVDRRSRRVMLFAVVLGVGTGWANQLVEARVGGQDHRGASIDATATVTSDARQTRYGWQVTVELRDGMLAGLPFLVRFDHRPPVDAGDVVSIEDRVSGAPRRIRGAMVAGVVDEPPVFEVVGSVSVFHELANGFRHHLLSGVDPSAGRGRALLAGFLVGETAAVDDVDLEALRRAGLSHFVAVSGSNVAMFLGLWWLLLAPVAVHPRMRAVSGVVGVIFFVVVTRGDASVVRAGAMALAVLVGRLAGRSIDAWTALGLAVTGSVLSAGSLATDVGFMLSVAATVGVLAGGSMFRFRPRQVALVLGASVAAQVAVAPVLLTAVGSVPLLAPLANLVAAPLVAASTAIGGVGALTDLSPLVSLGARIGEAVLELAAMAAPWPQLDIPRALGLVVAALATWRLPSLRPAAVVVAVALVVAGLWHGAIERPAVVFLDVGQGDAILVLGPDVTTLVDAGPDPVALATALDRYGVDRLDLLVFTHAHADHVEGARSVIGRIPTERIWADFRGESTASSRWLVGAAAEAQIPVDRPAPGWSVAGTGVAMTVQAPLRRYDDPNDQSIVLLVDAAGRSILLTGDVEAHAQADITPTDVDVLKVPHHGSDTSDVAWLAATSPELAVIQVGANDFGHPSPEVIAALHAVGATVLRTDTHGDVILEPAGYRHD